MDEVKISNGRTLLFGYIPLKDEAYLLQKKKNADKILVINAFKAKRKAYYSTSEYKAKKKAYRSTPEYKAKKKAYYLKRKIIQSVKENISLSDLV